MTKIDEMRKNMEAAGFYRPEDIEEICRLEEEYAVECDRIAAECAAEGYPDHGANYELRCEAARRYYDQQLEYINSNYPEEEGEEGNEKRFLRGKI